MRTFLIIFAAVLSTSCSAARNAKSPLRPQTSSLIDWTSKWYGGKENKFKAKTDHVLARQTTAATRKTLFARITVYWASQDFYSSRKMSATGKRLVSGKSAAVDFKLIKPNSTLSFFSNGSQKEFLAIDSGSAVKSRKASRKTGRNEPVIDIFFNTRSQAMAFLSTLPKNQIVEVTVSNNSTKAAKAIQ